ncbi:MAG: hypothetical protein GC161_04410 [Planctomycetaceae bacterium]|nr:hypothetical protein [Planctomycetaceae bacterium]
MTSIQDILEATCHRERVAWLSLVAMAAAYGPFFLGVALEPPSAPLPDLPSMGRFAGAVLVQVVVLGVGHAWFRLRWPHEARAPADERDRAIELRARRIAYHVLIVGIVLVGCVMPFSKHGWELIHTGIAAVVVAELVHYGLVVLGYRRG